MPITINKLVGLFWSALFAITFNTYMSYSSISKVEQKHMKRMLLLAAFLIAVMMLILSDNSIAGVICSGVGAIVWLYITIQEKIKEQKADNIKN